MNKLNFFQKIYWGWTWVYNCFDWWYLMMTDSEFDEEDIKELFWYMNIDYPKVVEES